MSYLKRKRKRKGNWGTPKVPASFKVGYGIVIIIIILGIVFPMFGISVIIVTLVEFLLYKKDRKAYFKKQYF
ncbi:hypothetical protein [uncultured Lacinutrix sp.]|uniref:hypothetical protein n=1 Tax=uncultured Lacinutrix sp. TaxID=574032 RepID=UPI0026339F00|nr:hypothetical protein [uncultured Lacinutrix sp.]